MNKKISNFMCIFAVTTILIPTVSALNYTPDRLQSYDVHVSIRLIGIDSDGRMIFNVTNTDDEVINMSTIFVKFYGGVIFFRANASTYVHIDSISPNESQILKTENPVARVWLLFHGPFLLGIYQLDLTYEEYHGTALLFIIRTFIRIL